MPRSWLLSWLEERGVRAFDVQLKEMCVKVEACGFLFSGGDDGGLLC